MNNKAIRVFIMLALSCPFLNCCNDGDSVFESSSWSSIIAASNKGEEYFVKKYKLNNINEMVGKTHSVNLDKYGNQNVRCIGVNHDEIYGTDKKALLTFEFEQVIYWDIWSNSDEDTNYSSSEIRKVLNGVFINDLPNELTSNIKTVSKKTLTCGGVSTVVATNERLFALSLVELNDDRNGSLEGNTYAYYKINDIDKLKKARSKNYMNSRGSGGFSYWTRSPDCNTANFIYMSQGSGNLVSTKQAFRAFGISPAFCL